MEKSDIDKLTPEQKAALAQVEASLALEKTDKSTYDNKRKTIVFVIIILMLAIGIGSMFLILRASVN